MIGLLTTVLMCMSSPSPPPPPFDGATRPFDQFALITDGELKVNFPPTSIIINHPPLHPDQAFH